MSETRGGRSDSPSREHRDSAGQPDGGRPTAPVASDAEPVAADRVAAASDDERTAPVDSPPVEIGGYDGPEPTRFGDWTHRGRCTDF